ncbi:MAG: hypothetical protein AAGJ10_01085 [Bacteroidota bacterium]
MNTSSSHALLAAALASLAIPVSGIALWINAASAYPTHAERVATYLTHFPAPLQSTLLLTLIQIAFAGLGLWFATRAFSHAASRPARWVSGAVAGVSCVLCMWLTFSIM